jgi:PPOX class probable F420-dependent enzyme
MADDTIRVDVTARRSLDGHGWDLDVAGYGAAHAPSLFGADAAVRSFLATQVSMTSDIEVRISPSPGAVTLNAAMAAARSTTEGVLATIRRNGRPQLSNVSYAAGDDDTIRILSTTARAKVPNLRRDPRASLYVIREDFYEYLVIDGAVSVSPTLAEGSDESSNDDQFAEMKQTYERIVGSAARSDELRKSFHDEGRVLIRFHPERAYGMVPTGPVGVHSSLRRRQ